jgi:hypothetical protein
MRGDRGGEQGSCLDYRRARRERVSWRLHLAPRFKCELTRISGRERNADETSSMATIETAR